MGKKEKSCWPRKMKAVVEQQAKMENNIIAWKSVAKKFNQCLPAPGNIYV